MARQRWFAGFNRQSIRVRLVVGYATALMVLLTLSATFVYVRVHIDLDTQLDHELTDRVHELTPLIGTDGVIDASPVGVEFQVLDANNLVLSSSSGMANGSLVNAHAFAGVMRRSRTWQIGRILPVSQHPLRVVAAPISRGTARVVVVGVRRDLRDESLRELLATLAIATAATLGFASIVGCRVAAAALRPVEQYRSQAAALAAGADSARLDVPERPDDEITRLGHTFNDVIAARDVALDHERRFVADASHELRTPLTLLSTRIQLLRRPQRDRTLDDAQLAELDTDVADLVVLTDQLLSLGSTASPNRGPVDLTEAVGSFQRHDATVDVSAAGDVVFDVPDTTLMIVAGELRVRQVVRNLIANACVHGAPPIRLCVRSHGGYAVLSVSDNGMGIDADLLPHITERFRRSDDARTRPGAGLGLAIVESMLRLDNADLRICSKGIHHRYLPNAGFSCEHPSSGTTATVAWPLAIDETGSPGIETG